MTSIGGGGADDDVERQRRELGKRYLDRLGFCFYGLVV